MKVVIKDTVVKSYSYDLEKTVREFLKEQYNIKEDCPISLSLIINENKQAVGVSVKFNPFTEKDFFYNLPIKLSVLNSYACEDIIPIKSSTREIKIENLKN